MDLTVYAAWLFSALNNDASGWMRSLRYVNHLPTVRSTCLMRSENSVPGATSGTFIADTVIPGLTIAPGVHGPLQSAGYRVVRVMFQTVPSAGLVPVVRM